jgi:hypothetical protein
VTSRIVSIDLLQGVRVELTFFDCGVEVGTRQVTVR